MWNLRPLIVSGLCVVWVAFGWGKTAAAEERVFRAGAATSNITPSIDSEPPQRSSSRYATHVHDELHARCLVLDDGAAQLAIVVCDLRHISADVVVDAKRMIERMTGIPPECVLISATHTHTSTGTRLNKEGEEPYYDYRAETINRGNARAGEPKLYCSTPSDTLTGDHCSWAIIQVID